MLFALACIAAFALMPASAAAETVYSHTGEFGGAGSGGGDFSSNPMPQRLAVHDESGKVLVADRGNHRIQVFSPTPAGADFDFAFGDSATISNPIGLAVDQDSGDVYVTAAGTTNAIVKFNPDDASDPTDYTEDSSFTSPPQGGNSGEISAFQSGPGDRPNGGGIAVDPTTGEILVADPGRNLIQRFDSDGAYLDDFDGCTGALCSIGTGDERDPFTGVRDLAVTSTGDIIVADVAADNSVARVDRFNGEGDLQATLSEGNDPVPNTQLDNSSLVVAVNPDTDEVLVSSKKTGGAFDDIPARIYQFEDDELVQELGVDNDRFNGFMFGFAIRGSDSGRLYAMATQSRLFSPVPRVQAFDAILLAEAAIDPVDEATVTSTQAMFSGTVTPDGFPTTWGFEYRPVGTGEWQRVPSPDGDAGDGTDPVAVDAQATDLEPNTDYEVRLVATTAGVESASEIVTFATAPGPPAVTTGTATLIADDGATLRGQVNPRNSETSYHFEYGRDTDYGNVAPASAADAGSGGTVVLVSEPIAGLDPGTTYHFRLVAENQAGTTPGSDRTFVTLAEPMPERSYEVVSQVPAGGAPVFPTSKAEAEGGNHVLYRIDTASPALPGHDLPHATYLAERGDGGWTTSPADLPHLLVSTASLGGVDVSADFTRTVVRTAASHDPDDQNESADDTTVGQDLYQRQPDGELIWITRDPRIEPGTPQTETAPVGQTGSPRESAMSADGRAFVFRSNRNLLDEDPNPSDVLLGGIRLYKWNGSELSLLSVTPGGEAPTGSEVTLGADATFSPNAVSRDGSRVFWRDGSQGYVQIDGEPTVEAPSGATYGWADPDLRRVVMVSAAGGLLELDVDTGSVRDLTAPADVRGVVAASEDVRRVYFVADAELDAEPSPLGEEPSPEGRNLYLAELDGSGDSPRLRFIAALGAADAGADLNIWRHRWGTKTAYASPDGSVLGFGSVADLTVEPTEGTRQLYVYDAAADTLECASCPADGSPPAGDVNGPVGNSDGWQPGSGIKRWVSSQGAVFFDTPTRLVPEDRNARRDVYEYRRGSLRLISTGDPESELARFSGASRDGSTVFFTTADALVPRDREPGLRKVYAARVGGGFPAPTPKPPCVGEDCQGAPEPSPPTAEPRTGVPAHGSIDADRGGRCEQLAVISHRRIALYRRTAARAGRQVSRARRLMAERRASPRTRRLVRQARRGRRQTMTARKAAVRSRRAAIRCARGER